MARLREGPNRSERGKKKLGSEKEKYIEVRLCERGQRQWRKEEGRGEGDRRSSEREPIALHNEAKAIIREAWLSLSVNALGNRPMRQDYCIYP